VTGLPRMRSDITTDNLVVSAEYARAVTSLGC